MEGDLAGLRYFLRLRVLTCIRFFQEFLGRYILEGSLPQVPVDTGDLLNSGQVFLNGEKFLQVGAGPNLKHFTIPSKNGVIIVNFSQSKMAGNAAKIYFNFGGKKWFDYSLYQEDKRGWLFMEMQILSALIPRAMRAAINKVKA
jgi:hypothetical protein